MNIYIYIYRFIYFLYQRGPIRPGQRRAGLCQSLTSCGTIAEDAFLKQHVSIQPMAVTPIGFVPHASLWLRYATRQGRAAVPVMRQPSS